MVKITKLDYKGRGIGKINGKIVFVENAIPGEEVDIKIIKETEHFIEAKVEKYINKSTDRIESKCPFYSECGGCDIMHISYDDQLKFKQEIITDMIRNNLNNNIVINDIVKCDKQFNYRNKVTFQVKNNIGFFKKNTYELEAINKCVICNEKINKIIPHLNVLELDKINKIVVRSNGIDVMIIIHSSNQDLNIDALKNKCESIYINVNEKYILKYGQEYLHEKIGDINYLISPDSFFQINPYTTKKLYDKIKSLVGKNKNVLDLYCGTGSIGLYVSDFNNVTGIEINKYAVEDANKNKKINNIKNIEFLCGDSGKKLCNIKSKIDTIIIDPPRSGLNKETINNIIKINPDSIIYVSCNPATLIRDLKIFETYYNVCEITPFDMFPNTYHVESVTLLKLR